MGQVLTCAMPAESLVLGTKHASRAPPTSGGDVVYQLLSLRGRESDYALLPSASLDELTLDENIGWGGRGTVLPEQQRMQTDA